MEDLQIYFDTWFKNTNDPWGYNHSKLIAKRIQLTIDFIKVFIDSQYSGHIIELGGFDGSVTKHLAVNFPNSKIIFNDISTVALDKARIKLSKYENIEYVLSNLSNINFNQQIRSAYVLLFECLYYLDEKGRQETVKNIKLQLPKAPIFISCPVKGGKYFTNESLNQLLSEQGYELQNSSTLTLQGHLDKFNTKLTRYLFNRYSFQKIFYFKPIN